MLDFEIETKPSKGQWVHVEGWLKGCVFEFQEYNNDLAILKTPKSRKTFKTKNRLLKTRKHSK